MKRIIAILLAMAIILSNIPITAFATSEEQETINFHIVSDETSVSADELFEGYASQLFYGNSISTFGTAAGEMLSADEKVFYDALVPVIRQIANGQRSSGMISVGQPFYDENSTLIRPDAEIVIPEFTQEMFGRIIDALLADLPYEMYWYDKVTGCSLVGMGPTGIDQLVFSFTVAEKYRGGDAYSADTSITGAASNAAANAQAVIKKYASDSDYEKLLGYKNEICELVSYNQSAADGNIFTTDIDPWQLIYVFDGDTSTNVVCEGYSKAFMYLCDMSSFTGDVECYTVMGSMNGGGHMWNIVSIDDKNYLTDITNSDEGTVGADGSLFMAGAIGSADSGYTVGTTVYIYDYDMLALWEIGDNSILKMENTSYNPETQLGENSILAQGVCGDNLIWALTNDGVLNIRGTGEMWNYECIDTSHASIFKWSHPWFDVKDYITTIVIEDGVTSIGNCAFAQCFNLQEVEFSSTLASIGRQSFYNCSISKLDIDTTNISYINNSAFQYCPLTEIYFPETLSVIDSYAFSECNKLEKIVFIGDAPNIYEYAFAFTDATVYYPGDNETWTKDIINSYGLNMLWVNSLTGEEFSTDANSDGGYGEGSGDNSGPGIGSGDGEGEGLGPGNGPGEGSGEGSGSGSGSENKPDSPSEYLLHGTCGVNVLWSFDTNTGTLTISGTGKMDDYSDFVSNRPYHHFTDNITSVIVEEGITHIGYGAFSGCHNLENVLLHEGLISIGGHSFAATAIRDLTIPASVNSIGVGAFVDSRLEKVLLSSSIELIDDAAFSGCFKLTEIVFPNTLKEIGERAFQHCYELNNITFEGSAPAIERYAFMGVVADCYYPVFYDGWNSNALLNYDGDLTWHAYDENGNIDDKGTETEDPSYSGICGDNIEWTLKNGILTISGTGPMYNYNYISDLTPWFNYGELIKTVIVKEGVTSIGSFAFYECNHFADIHLPETIECISDGAFYGCENLENIAIPQSVAVVGKKAFRDCFNIKNLSFSNNLTYIGNEPFYRCYNLNISVDPNNEYYYVGEYGELIGAEQKELIFYPFTNTNTEYQVPEEIKIIGTSAFNSNKILSHVYLPEGLERIKTEAFSNMTYLEELDIPHSVEVIEGSAFYDSRSIARISLPDTMDSIGLAAFEYCTGITQITIPKGITYLEDSLFVSCSQLQELILPDTIAEIGTNIILGCRSLERIIFTGDAPSFSSDSFYCPGSLVVKAYYPADNSSWTDEVMQNYAGNIEWIPYSTYENIPNTHIHSFGISIVPSTCQYAGYILKSCECGYSDSDVSFNIGEHKEIYTSGKEATCTNVGWTEGTLCEYCNCLFTSELIPELGHTGGTEASCTEPQLCIRCGFTVALPSGHNYFPSVIKNSTCTEYGVKRFECLHCGDYYDEEFDGYPNVTEHNLSITPKVDPTCTQSGMTEISYCLTCGEILSVGTAVSALGHNIITVPAIEPTCTKGGSSEKQYCDRCNEVFVEPLTFEPNGHNYKSFVTGSTCVEQGYTIYICNVCEDSYIGEYIPMKDHSYGDYVSNGDGTMSKECSVCHNKETIPEPVTEEVVRVKGRTRYETSIAIANATKEKMGVAKFDNIIIASGTGFADALAGSYLAKVKSAPILMSSGKNDTQLKDYVKANLKAGGTVYILGGTAAVPQNTEDAMKSIDGITVKRLKDKNRYGTNLAILREAGVQNEDIIVATGLNFADSLSASAVGKPILLVDGKGTGLNAAQKSFLAGVNANNIYIIGGTGAVSEAFENQLKAYGNVERVKGKTRYETSVAIADKFFTNPQSAVVAFAENFPDGLCGGPLSTAMNAPLILTKTGKQSATKSYMQRNDIGNGAVLGGASLIDDSTAMNIFGADEVIVK